MSFSHQLRRGAVIILTNEEGTGLAKTVFMGRLDVFSISENKFLRKLGKNGDLSQLGTDEYFSFSMIAHNVGEHAYAWEHACIRVDGGEPWYWARGQIQASNQALFHVAYCNMKKCMTPGVHTAVWYFDGQAVYKERFVITQKTEWEKVFPIPSRNEINNYQNLHKRRSPYIAAHLDIPPKTRYTEYMIDFKATHLPKGTYCCLGCWTMDHSVLEKQFEPVRAENGWVNAYAGFQKIEDGRMVSIMSFWDTFYRDALGKGITVRAKRLYPKSVIGGGRFWGEGIGERSTAPLDWKADHWYRMHLKCTASQETTVVEQWVCDLETGEYTLLCRYDTDVPNSSFIGSMAVFLENYLPEAAGEIRSMEVCNARYLDSDTKQWETVKKAYVTAQGGVPQYEGSYNFGVSENRLWMITSGVGGDWFHNEKGKQGTYVTLEDD